MCILLQPEDKQQVASSFYNDTYLIDQHAGSAIEIIERNQKLMKASKKEMQENEYLIREGDSLLDKRFETCLKWYIRKACKYKNGYYFCTLVSGIFPFIVAAVNSFNDNSTCMRIMVAILSTCASIAVVVLTTYRFQEKWMRYRMAAEFLKRERVRYLYAKEKKDCDQDKLDAEFLQTMEQYMEGENADWKNASLENLGEKREKRQSIEKEKVNI